MRALPILLLVFLLLPLAAEEPVLEITTSMGLIRCRLFDQTCPETVRTITELAEGRRPFTDPKTGQQVTRPFYDGLTFHRVVPGFMIQGGDPLGNGQGGPGFSFKDEINAASLGLDREMALQGEQLHPQCQYMAAQFVQTYVEPRLQGLGIGPTATMNDRNSAVAAILPQLQRISLERFYSDIGYHYDPTLPASRRPVRGVLAMANSGPNTNGSQFFITVGDAPHLTGKHTIFGDVIEGMQVADAIAAVPCNAANRPNEPVRIITMRLAKAAVPQVDAGK